MCLCMFWYIRCVGCNVVGVMRDSGVMLVVCVVRCVLMFDIVV